MRMGVPPSSVNCLVAAGFFPLAPGADDMRVPKPAAGIITTTFIAGCKYTRAGASVQIGLHRASRRRATRKPQFGVEKFLRQCCPVSAPPTPPYRIYLSRIYSPLELLPRSALR